MRFSAVVLFLTLAAPVPGQPAPDDRSTWDQTAQGIWLLGGGAGLTRSSSSTTATAAPYVGLFVADGLALAAQVELSYSRTKFTSDLREESISSTRVGIGPGVQYYFGGQGASLRPFAEADLLATYSRLTSDFLDVETAEWSVSGGAAAGVSVPIARNVAVQAQAFYRAYDLTGNTSSYYGLSAGFSTFIY